MLAARGGTPGVVVATLALAACAPVPRTVPPPVPFETFHTWIVTGSDSIPLTVELAVTPAQAERGLMDRPALDPEGGMLFLFDEPRGADDGFWMWRTLIPLDLAVLDGDGRIVAVQGMDPCHEEDPEACTPYVPGVPHSGALEVNRGWLARNGVEVGARVVLP